MSQNTVRRGCLPALCIATLCGLLSGCSTLYTSSGTGALVKGDKRAIVVTQRTDNDKVGKLAGQPRYVACAEPSPDVMTAYAAQFAADLSKTSADGDKISAEAKAALQQAAAFIGMRTPSIQLLRDAMYRVCEAYANGGLDNDQYELLMRRYQRQIVAMMAIEQLTQIARVQPISLTTEGSVGGERPLSEWTGEIKRQNDLLDKQQDALAKADEAGKAAGAALEKDPSDAKAKTAKAAAEKAKSDAAAESAKIKGIIAVLEKSMRGGTTLAGRSAADITTVGGGDAKPEAIQAVAPVVERLAMKVLDTDDTGALCFAHYSNYKAADSKNHPVAALCTAYMDQAKALYDLRASYLRACNTAHSSSPAALRECREKAPAPPAVMQMHGGE